MDDFYVCLMDLSNVFEYVICVEGKHARQQTYLHFGNKQNNFLWKPRSWDYVVCCYAS